MGSTGIGKDLVNSETPHDTPSRYEPLDVPALLPFWLGCLLAFFVLGVFLWVALEFPIARHQETRGPIEVLPARRGFSPRRSKIWSVIDAQKTSELEAEGSAKGKRVGIEDAMRATASQGWGPQNETEAHCPSLRSFSCAGSCFACARRS